MDRGYEELTRLDEEGEARQLVRLRDKVRGGGGGRRAGGRAGWGRCHAAVVSAPVTASPPNATGPCPLLPISPAPPSTTTATRWLA
jgi:hypothetical protein